MLTLTVTDADMASTGVVPDTVDIVLDSVGVTIIGTPGDDLVNAGHTVAGEPLPTTRDDLIMARSGDDIAAGLAGNDRIFGAAGDDRLKGNSGNDLISGGAGDDNLFGNAGNDRLDGRRGVNALTGGAGDDIFLFTTDLGQRSAPPWVSRLSFAEITDFTVGEDRIGLSAGIFGSLANVHYRASTGALIFANPDGDHALRFATLDKGLDIDASDFLLV